MFMLIIIEYYSAVRDLLQPEGQVFRRTGIV